MEEVKQNEDLKEFANGKSSKDCTIPERIAVYKASKPKGREETPKERLDRINRFRCGW